MSSSKYCINEKLLLFYYHEVQWDFGKNDTMTFNKFV